MCNDEDGHTKDRLSGWFSHRVNSNRSLSPQQPKRTDVGQRGNCTQPKASVESLIYQTSLNRLKNVEAIEWNDWRENSLRRRQQQKNENLFNILIRHIWDSDNRLLSMRALNNESVIPTKSKIQTHLVEFIHPPKSRTSYSNFTLILAEIPILVQTVRTHHYPNHERITVSPVQDLRLYRRKVPRKEITKSLFCILNRIFSSLSIIRAIIFLQNQTATVAHGLYNVQCTYDLW